MLEQGYITRPIYEESIRQALPSAHEVQAPHEQTVEGIDAGYFTSWVDQQVIERYRSRAFLGGLRIKTTLDLEMQRAAEQAVGSYLGYPGGPTAAMVVIENSTGEVRAMVGGRDYNQSPFNLATEGERQPGSSFKAFDLAAALEDGISPESVWASKQKVFYVPGPHGVEKFVVHNDEGAYSGSNTLTGATAFSDNSIYAEVGLKVGTHRIAGLARRMGITTPLSTNPAMTIGGLTVGVTPLDMAHAYETLASGGLRIAGTLGEAGAPVGIQEVTGNGSDVERNRVTAHRILPASVATTETSMLETVIQYGTGRAAALGQFAAGKTGTTSNYGDAWFVGWDSKYTAAVWVGYPNGLVPMTTDFNGQPVLGGTFPALIWHQFMTSALQIDKNRAESRAAHTASGASTTGSGTEAPRTEAGGPAATGPATSTPAGGAHTDALPRHAAEHRPGAGPERLGRRLRRAEPRTRRREHARPRDAAADAGASGGGEPRDARPLRAAVERRQPCADGRGRPGGLGPGRGSGPAPGSRPRARAGPGRQPRLPCRPPAPATGGAPATDGAPATTSPQPSGRGRETFGLPARQKRHGSPAARVIPMRGPATTARSSRSARAGSTRTGPRARSAPFSASVTPSAWVSLPGPEHSASSPPRLHAAAPRRARIAARPAHGSSARIRTPAPTPSGSQTAFRRAWMP